MMMIRLSTLSCPELTEKVDDFLDGDVTWLEWLNFRMHVLTCGPCLAYLRQARMTVETLSRLPGDPVPDEVRDGLLNAFREWHNHDGG